MMPRLRAFVLNIGWKVLDVEGSGQVVNLVRAAARCHHLQVLKLPGVIYTADLDQALADCVRANALLEELSVSYEFLQRHVAIPLPATLDAIESSYALKVVHIVHFDRVSYRSTDPSYLRLKLCITMITQLNAAGRVYLSTDATNRQLGLNVLGQVKNDLNCIFFHLRENPILIQPAVMTGVLPNSSYVGACRKRKASPSNEKC
jgi:hypothetical protein